MYGDTSSRLRAVPFVSFLSPRSCKELKDGARWNLEAALLDTISTMNGNGQCQCERCRSITQCLSKCRSGTRAPPIVSPGAACIRSELASYIVAPASVRGRVDPSGSSGSQAIMLIKPQHSAAVWCSGSIQRQLVQARRSNPQQGARQGAVAESAAGVAWRRVAAASVSDVCVSACMTGGVRLV